MKDFDRYFFQIKKDFKPLLIKKRKEFMELLLRTLSDDEEATKDLNFKFGTTLVTKIDNGNDMSIFVDGERIYKI
jgi:hypothetical protein